MGDAATRCYDVVVIAGGSVPRRIDAVPVDHEHIYDSDSILTLPYLPRSA